MSAVTSYCPSCGFLLDPDCDFCPGCGAAKRKTQAPPLTRDPHSWMKDSPSTWPANTPTIVQPPQVQVVQYPAPVASSTVQDSGLGPAVRTMGIIVLSLMVVGLIPCLGWINYLNFAFGFVTLILSIVAIASARSDSARSAAFLGLAFVILANFIGVIRLILGGGCV